MSELLRIRSLGIDLDNTLVDYSHAFARGVESLALFGGEPPPGKTALRDALRARDGGEDAWRDLQAFVYGEGVRHARPFPGVERFVRAARAAGIRLQIVSHKTRFAAARPDVDLREAAAGWLAELPYLRDVPIAFAETRDEKLRLIAAAGVDAFVDDLPEVLEDPGFPPRVERWLFAPDGAPPGARFDRVVGGWDELRDLVAAR